MNIRSFLAAFFLATLAASAPAQEKFRVYLGTYSKGDSKGIYQCELNLADGSLTPPTLAVEASDPSFLAFHPNQPFLYAVNEDEASISAFAIDTKTGTLTFLNAQPSQGGAPCHLVVDPTGNNVLAANYSGGSCLCLPIGADGKLGEATSFQQHQGERVHGHAIHVDPTNKFALCCDLGLDKVVIYGFDPAKGLLKPHGAFDTPKGTGPRHFAWSKDGKMAFINGQSNLTLVACDYDSNRGVLKQRQVLSTLRKTSNAKAAAPLKRSFIHPASSSMFRIASPTTPSPSLRSTRKTAR